MAIETARESGRALDAALARLEELLEGARAASFGLHLWGAYHASAGAIHHREQYLEAAQAKARECRILLARFRDDLAGCGITFQAAPVEVPDLGFVERVFHLAARRKIVGLLRAVRLLREGVAAAQGKLGPGEADRSQ